VVILGDGCTAADVVTFRRNVDRHLNVLWSSGSHKSYRSHFNVYRVEILSKISGADYDPEPLFGTYGHLGLHRAQRAGSH
jgi:hypothetical protein